MAAIDDLIAQVSDPVLRTRLRAETKKLKDNKPFGLVFERHLPECTLLYDVPVKENALVARKDDASDLWTVQRMDGEMALCQKYRGKEQKTIPVRELTTATEFGTPIYPYLEPLDEVENAPESDLWHTVIEADNYHALQLLEYAYAGKVDCIYIDPPYNTGAKDWKYNNDYVDENDKYRHSKWLSFMKRRLKLAKKLLNPMSSVLIIAIDEKEYLHLGMLLEEIFPEAEIEMVTSVVNARGKIRIGKFAKTEEYIFFVKFGCAQIHQEDDPDYESGTPVPWRTMRRSSLAGARGRHGKGACGPNQFFPVFVNVDGIIVDIGEPLPEQEDISKIQVKDGAIPVFPIRDDGTEMNWGVTRETAVAIWKKGYIRVGKYKPGKPQPWEISYLTEGKIEDIETGKATIVGREKGGWVKAFYLQNKKKSPSSVWTKPSHNAETCGTNLIKDIFSEDSRFNYPKSLYAVQYCLDIVIDRPDALVLDFFAGSGTTLHAVNLLNADDGGHRRCILVTNNEVSYDEEEAFKAKGLKPGDAEWDKFGIARYVTWPRTKCSILGQDIHGNPLDGKKDVYFTSQTIEVEKSRTFYQIGFLDASKIRDKKTQEQVLSLLRDKKGKQQLPKKLATGDGFIVSDDHTASILFDAQMAEDWLDALEGQEQIVDFYIVTPEAKTFRSIKKQVNELLGPVNETEMVKRPMAEGFPANANFFHLGFLDKNAVSRGTQLEKLLPVLWLKAGAIGKCPAQLAGDRFLLFPANKFAVLVDVRFSHDFQQAVQGGGYRTVYIVADYEPEFRAIRQELGIPQAFQLYKDYLSNFAINKGRA